MWAEKLGIAQVRSFGRHIGCASGRETGGRETTKSGVCVCVEGGGGQGRGEEERKSEEERRKTFSPPHIHFSFPIPLSLRNLFLSSTPFTHMPNIA